MAENSFKIKDDVTGKEYTFHLSNGKLELSEIGDAQGDAILVSANWPAVHGLRDGQNVDAATFNKPITELSERTTYLFNKYRAFDLRNPLATTLFADAPLDQSNTPNTGDVVYLDPDTDTYKKALADVSAFDYFSVAGSAYAAGILVKKEGTKGTVASFGRLDLDSLGISVSLMLEKDEKFRPGLYYLSSTEAGKMTAFPSGPRVVVGSFTRAHIAVINIHAKELGEAHVHRSYALRGVPAGDQVLTEEGPDGIHKYVGYAPDQYSSNGNPDGDIYPGLMFTGEWLKNESITYNFEIQSYAGDGMPGERFGSDPGVFLHWETGDGARSGRLEFHAFNTPIEFENGAYISLTSGDPDGQIVYKVETDALSKRQWNGIKLPEDGAGWRSLTTKEEEDFIRLHRNHAVPCFIYNIGFDKDMQAFFPPVPAKSASLVVNGVEIPSDNLGEKNYTYSIENDSLYWYDNTWEHAPWPGSYFSRLNRPETWEEKKMVLHFIKTATTDMGPVMSLSGAPGSGVRVVSCSSGEAASVGDLMIDIDPLGDVVEDSLTGYKVVKAGGGGVFKTGPVVERIVQGPGIVLTRIGTAPLGQGTVVISTAEGGIQGDFEEVALQNAKQDMVGMFPYVRLLGWRNDEAAQNIPSAFVLKFHVPYDNTTALYKVGFSASVFGTQGYVGTDIRYAGLKMDYSILPDLTPVSDAETGTYASANVQSDLISPDSARVLELPIVSVYDGVTASYSEFDPVLIHTVDGEPDITGKRYAAFGNTIPYDDECKSYMNSKQLTTVAVKPGYTVAVRISRGPAVSGVVEYTAPVGFMNMRWMLERID